MTGPVRNPSATLCHSQRVTNGFAPLAMAAQRVSRRIKRYRGSNSKLRLQMPLICHGEKMKELVHLCADQRALRHIVRKSQKSQVRAGKLK